MGQDRYLGTRPGRGQFVENVRELAGESFREAKGWQELHASLSQKGLTLQPSRAGRGLVITDGRRYVAASRVEREMSRPRLEARLGRFEPVSPDLRKIQEISRQLMSRGRLEAMRGRYQGSMARLGTALANHERAAGRVSEASRQLDAALGRVYRDPGAARQRIEATLERHGAGETVRALPIPGTNPWHLLPTFFEHLLQGRKGEVHRPSGWAHALPLVVVPRGEPLHSWVSNT